MKFVFERYRDSSDNDQEEDIIGSEQKNGLKTKDILNNKTKKKRMICL